MAAVVLQAREGAMSHPGCLGWFLGVLSPWTLHPAPGSPSIVEVAAPTRAALQNQVRGEAALTRDARGSCGLAEASGEQWL
jgi:hypothetical protein